MLDPAIIDWLRKVEQDRIRSDERRIEIELPVPEPRPHSPESTGDGAEPRGLWIIEPL